MGRIDELNRSIQEKGRSLANELKNSIIQITIPQGSRQANQPTASKDVPSRPWLLLGSAATIASLGGMMSGEKEWPYWVGACGLVSLGVGVYKWRKTSAVPVKPTVNYEETKDFVISKCSTLIDHCAHQWDQFMQAKKDEVQSLIRQSTLTENQKEEQMFFTYYPNSINLNTRTLIDDLNAIPEDGSFVVRLMQAKQRYALATEKAVLETINKQIEEYSKIVI